MRASGKPTVRANVQSLYGMVSHKWIQFHICDCVCLQSTSGRSLIEKPCHLRFVSSHGKNEPPRSHLNRKSPIIVFRTLPYWGTCSMGCPLKAVGCAAPPKLGNEVGGKNTTGRSRWNPPRPPLSNIGGGGTFLFKCDET